MSDASIDRLTANERECLQRVLDHQTAKEMARDLGISHHAVEKRLKRARQKLGAATSLEAARWYGQAVSGSSDLGNDNDKSAISGPASPPSGDRSRRFAIMVFIALITGGITLATMLSATDGVDSAAEEENTPRVSKVTFDPVKDRNRFRIEMAPEPGYDAYDLGFEVTDNDRSNTVSVAEFLKAARMFDYSGYMASGGDGENSLTTIFERLDSNQNGMIDRDEYIDLSFINEDGERFVFEIVTPSQP